MLDLDHALAPWLLVDAALAGAYNTAHERVYPGALTELGIPATALTGRSQLKLHAFPRIGSRQLGSFQPSHIREFVTQREEQPRPGSESSRQGTQAARSHGLRCQRGSRARKCLPSAPF
ncbi:hypothetical protein [Streptomyces capitiformicae]|uniref:Uncharacterized protein n=1 Tax=Streptomyces capitiformicae TaxID=2014920 RepID=A0A918Z1C9_9ACTN|nr:hypothetical protein GCM10017771_48770 [Streptomyces capitiformicae]